jgi:hypothetical protein
VTVAVTGRDKYLNSLILKTISRGNPAFFIVKLSLDSHLSDKIIISPKA